MKVLITAVSLLLTSLLITGTNQALASTIQDCNAPPGSYCWILINLTSGDQLTGSFSVTGGPPNSVFFQIHDPSGIAILAMGGTSGTTFGFTAGATGGYKLYFDNSLSRASNKSVTVDYTISRTLIPGVGSTQSYVIGAGVVALGMVGLTLLVKRLSYDEDSGNKTRNRQDDSNDRSLILKRAANGVCPHQ